MSPAKYFSLTVLILCIGPSMFGQSDPLYRPSLSIKYNPVAFVAYTPGIELGVERAISQNASLHLGGSYINDFGIAASRNFSGYKLISEYRFYSPFSEAPNNSFIALSFNLKRVNANGKTYLNKANGNYQELTDITVNNTTLDFLAAFGKVYPMNAWLSMDLSVVAGTKRLSIFSDDIPDDAFLNISEAVLFDFTPNEPGHYWFPVFRLQFKLNFAIK
jgi:hypothetical protein